jgi:hypothetical protein
MQAASRLNRLVKQRPRLMNIGLTLGIIVIVLIVLAWLGLRVQPVSFALYPQGTALESTPIPQHLPAPVERFYREIYGDEIPVINSAVITGRATMRVMGITFPARFRFIHQAGQNYRHYIEATWFGFPIMKVNESYLQGNSRLELPFGVTENEPKVNQAANLGLWAEAIWFPAYFLTDPRVRWEAVDEVTAVLVVPFEDTQERFIVRFDPVTGFITLLESMRYKDAASAHKTLWLNEAQRWGRVNGYLLPDVAALTWVDDGTPWAVMRVEDIVYNSDVSTIIRARGP